MFSTFWIYALMATNLPELNEDAGISPNVFLFNWNKIISKFTSFQNSILLLSVWFFEGRQAAFGVLHLDKGLRLL